MITKKKTTRRLVPLRSIAKRLNSAGKMLISSARDLEGHARKGVQPSKAPKSKTKRAASATTSTATKPRATRR